MLVSASFGTNLFLDVYSVYCSRHLQEKNCFGKNFYGVTCILAIDFEIYFELEFSFIAS